MSNLTVSPDFKVESRTDIVLISDASSLRIVCAHCCAIKRVVYLTEGPTVQQVHRDAQSGCLCGTQMSNKTLLQELYANTGTCQTVEELRLYILSLASAAA